MSVCVCLQGALWVYEALLQPAYSFARKELSKSPAFEKAMARVGDSDVSGPVCLPATAANASLSVGSLLSICSGIQEQCCWLLSFDQCGLICVGEACVSSTLTHTCCVQASIRLPGRLQFCSLPLPQELCSNGVCMSIYARACVCVCVCVDDRVKCVCACVHEGICTQVRGMGLRLDVWT